MGDPFTRSAILSTRKAPIHLLIVDRIQGLMRLEGVDIHDRQCDDLTSQSLGTHPPQNPANHSQSVQLVTVAD